VGLLLMVGVLGVGCDSSSSEAKTTAVAPADPPPAAPAPAAPPPAVAVAQQSYKEAEFAVSLAGPTSGKAGETLALQVTLQAATGYHVNQEYPLKFQINKGTGVVPEKDIVQKADGTVDAHTATLPVKVKLEKPGSFELGGRLSFSVCKEGDASVCLLEKRELGIKLDAS
jgi:hypothetical protein